MSEERGSRADASTTRQVSSPAERPPSFLLTLVLAVSVWGFVAVQLYRMIVEPIEVSLSAEYEPYSRWLTVRGGAFREAEAIQSGLAKVVFETSYPNATHSFHVPVVNGRFAVDAQIGAAADRPGTLRRVVATVEASGFGQTGVGKVLGPYEVDGWILYAVFFTWSVLVGTFVWWFTGEYSRVKQRYAIIYSYVLAALFLIVPLAIPIAVVVVPGLAPVLARTPVGFLRVHTATVSAEQIAIDQWAVNIGGTPTLSRPRRSGPSTPAPEPQTTPPTDSSAPPPAISQALPESEGDPSAGPALADLAREATGKLSAAADRAKAAVTEERATDIDAATESFIERDESGTERSYDVTGGLVVPLYVVILATIGGAFRMTRSVPVIERKIRSVESRRLQRVSISVKDWIEVPMQAALGPFAALGMGRERKPDGGSVAVHGTAVETKVVEERITGDAPAAAKTTSSELVQAVEAVAGSGGTSTETVTTTTTEQSQTPATPAPRRTPEDELARAREQLTHQVLFLFTSPFMGILAYYALVFIHAEFGTKTPIVAIVAFVSGIKSEDVLQKIVSLAQGQLPTSKTRPTA